MVAAGEAQVAVEAALIAAQSAAQTAVAAAAAVRAPDRAVLAAVLADQTEPPRNGPQQHEGLIPPMPAEVQRYLILAQQWGLSSDVALAVLLGQIPAPADPSAAAALQAMTVAAVAAAPGPPPAGPVEGAAGTASAVEARGAVPPPEDAPKKGAGAAPVKANQEANAHPSYPRVGNRSSGSSAATMTQTGARQAREGSNSGSEGDNRSGSDEAPSTSTPGTEQQQQPPPQQQMHPQDAAALQQALISQAVSDAAYAARGNPLLGGPQGFYPPGLVGHHFNFFVPGAGVAPVLPSGLVYAQSAPPGLLHGIPPPAVAPAGGGGGAEQKKPIEPTVQQVVPVQDSKAQQAVGIPKSKASGSIGAAVGNFQPYKGTAQG